MNNLRIFGLGGAQDFARSIADILGTNLNKHCEKRRPDGELYTASLDNVRGCDVFVIFSFYDDIDETVNDKIVKCLIFINSLRHASARRITLVTGYLPYMRQDRKTESRAPIATQAIAMLFESVGVDRVLTMDVHNLGAEQNAFRIPIDNLEAKKPLADAITQDYYEYMNKLTVLSPDVGGAGRTKAFQQALQKRIFVGPIEIVYVDKTRIDANSVKVQVIGNVVKRNVIIVDDLISTGGTLAECQYAVEKAGGKVWGVAATHGLFVGNASDNLKNIPHIYITDTVPVFRLNEKAIKVVSVTSMFAEAIRRIHLEGGSISELLDD